MSSYRDNDHYDIQFTTRQLAVLFGLLAVIVGGVFVGGIVIGRGMSPGMAEAISARRSAPPPAVSEPELAVSPATADGGAAGDSLRLPISPAPDERAATEPAASEPAARVASTSPDELAARTLAGAERPRAAERTVATPAAVPPPPVQNAPNGRFTIQVAAFRDRAAAERLLAQLAEKGIEGYLEGTPAGIFRVRVGRFESREAARTVAARLEREQFATLVTSR